MQMNIKYRLFSLAMLVMMIPALLGIHIFNHYCNACLKSDVTVSIISSDHEYTHECPACTCDAHCPACHDKFGNHKCHNDDPENCTHEYLMFKYMGNLEVRNFSLKVVAFALPFKVLLPDLLISSNKLPIELKYARAVLQVPDDPSPEQNCVFLL